MLRILLNRLKPQAEETIKEENRQVSEKIGAQQNKFLTFEYSVRNTCNTIKNLYHVFVNFKKVFGRVWHAALWTTVRLYNINANLIGTIECLYYKATDAICYDNNIEEWLRTTTGVRQGRLLSPTFYNIFLMRIMADSLEDHGGAIRIGGRAITNLHFLTTMTAHLEKSKS